MDKKNSGAWIIHHTNKLQSVSVGISDYEQIDFAGKCGILLNALAGSDENVISTDRLTALAKANGISVRLGLQDILTELERQRLIDIGKESIAILGLTTSQVLENTSEIFEDANPGSCEKAVIDLAEKVSELPVPKQDALEYISDIYKIPNTETSEILNQSEQIGFFDSEDSSDGSILFNGNLFRRDNIGRTSAILKSLSSEDERHIAEITQKLKNSGCLAKKDVIDIIGETLYSKMIAIGYLDQNSIGNESGTYSFITRPAAFSKFSNSSADDAFDLAKAFVTSLTYGMTLRPSSQGRIRMIDVLMEKLINGYWVGPATAIGQDYKILEMKGVVQVQQTSGGLFNMKLLKKEVGQLALMVIKEGDVGGTALLEFPGVSATKYGGPEMNRTIMRKRQTDSVKRGVSQLLSDLRTGDLR